ncbi:MAG: GTP pyrophosphokinase family protein [Lachnospiraceae bacterium]|nr:GTP pyrophosphokinase family protein [Lachnospiraceae bacterium]
MLVPDTQVLDMSTIYKQLMFYYEAGIDQITSKLQIMNKEFALTNDRNPIESIKSRIKSMESIMNKMQKKYLEMTLENLVRNIKDVAGIRVVCPFISDVYRIAEILSSQSDIDVIEVKDYIKEPKESGYRSLHLIVMVEVNFSTQKKKVPVEIQLRTIAMNCWASLEHQLHYKKEHAFTEEMKEELKACAVQLADTDMRMQSLSNQVFGENKDVE